MDVASILAYVAKKCADFASEIGVHPKIAVDTCIDAVRRVDRAARAARDPDDVAAITVAAFVSGLLLEQNLIDLSRCEGQFYENVCWGE